MCEAHSTDRLWTLPNGRCILVDKYDVLNLENITNGDKCQFLLKCGFYQGTEKRCPCGRYFSPCFSSLDNLCSIEPIPYPKGGIISPYLLFLYDRRIPYFELKKAPDWVQMNGTIKCRGFSVNINRQDTFGFLSTLRLVEYFLCTLAQEESVIDNNGYDQHCNYQSRTFNNRSYHFIDVCKVSKECISAYRIRDGIPNCADIMDETQYLDIQDICLNNHRYRFRCSLEEPTCLSVTALGNSRENCKNKFDELWMGTNRKLSDLACNSESKEDCDSLRQYIESSWSFNDINQSISQLRIPFRAYCDTFWSLASKEDENSSECRR